MNILEANVEAIYQRIQSGITLGSITTIPAAQVYRDFENAADSESFDGEAVSRKLPCVFISCEDPKETVVLTGVFTSHPQVEIQVSADDTTGAEMSAACEQIFGYLNYVELPAHLSASLDSFTALGARIISQTTRPIGRRMARAIQIELVSAQADL